MSTLIKNTDNQSNSEQTKQMIKTGLSFVPYVGDALDVYDAIDNAKKGNYVKALAGIGLLAVPNIIEKPLKAGYKFVKNAYLAKKINNVLNKKPILQKRNELPLEDKYMFHNGHTKITPAGYNGKKYTYIQQEATPGALQKLNGKYKSVRPPSGNNPDLLWWDTKGHNYGEKVYVTKQDKDAVNVLSNLKSLNISKYNGVYNPNYYVTKQKPINQVIEYTFDPISGSAIPHMPNKILNNKMSYEEILKQSEQLKPRSTSTKTSLAFFERQPSKITKGEKLGIPKGQERTIINNEKEILNNAKAFAEKYNYDIPKTISDIKNMYNQHNSFFRVPNNHKSVIEDFDPLLSKLPVKEQYFKLASKGYPESMRSYDMSKNGIYSDDFVFVAPNYKKITPYLTNEVPAVMLRRPFKKSNPLTWHKDAEWNIQSNDIPYNDVFGKGKIGTAQIGNSNPEYEFKISTQYLQPIKIADISDKGTFLGDYLTKEKNNLLKKDNIKTIIESNNEYK